MNLNEFQSINGERALKWHKNGLIEWSLLEWAGAMCGESGEAANYAKKIKRLDVELPNKKAGLDINNRNELVQGLAKEVADSIIYGLLILTTLDMDASEVIADVFDQKSIEYGFPERAPR